MLVNWGGGYPPLMNFWASMYECLSVKRPSSLNVETEPRFSVYPTSQLCVVLRFLIFSVITVAESLCFYTCLSVILFTEGVCPVHDGIHSSGQTPRGHTSPGQTTPRSTPPGSPAPLKYPPRLPLQRTVRILLECILVICEMSLRMILIFIR